MHTVYGMAYVVCNILPLEPGATLFCFGTGGAVGDSKE